jgi:putative addiction module component (TIGR02574 family)
MRKNRLMLMRQERKTPRKASAAGVCVELGPIGKHQRSASDSRSFLRRRHRCAITELARLSPRQRLDLIESLWESLDDEDVPVTDAQRAELDQRIAGFDQDREHSVP